MGVVGACGGCVGGVFVGVCEFALSFSITFLFSSEGVDGGELIAKIFH